VRIEGNFDIAASRDAVYRHITDPGLMAKCVPGCEAIEQLSATGYRACVTISDGGGVDRARGHGARRDCVVNTGLFHPASVAEALALLARVPEAKIISGGAPPSPPVAP